MSGASHARGACSLINLGALLGNLNDYEGEPFPPPSFPLRTPLLY